MTLTQSGKAQSANWNDGGADNQWTTSANWSTGTVPTALNTTQVIIDSPTSPALITGGTTQTATNLSVGQDFTGTLSLGGTTGGTPNTTGGSLTVTNTATLGLTPNGFGFLNVFGGTGGNSSSALTVGGQLTVGGFSNFGGGSGALTVSSSTATSTATVTANGGLVLDAVSNQSAAVLVTGGAAILDVNGGPGLIVGNDVNGNGDNVVEITDHSVATVYSGSVIVGNGGKGTNYLLVENGASLTQTSGVLTVGNESTGNNTLNVFNGGTLNASGITATIGEGSGVAGTVAVYNGGTLDTGELVVGQSGTGILNVYNGGTLTATSLIFSNSTDSSGIGSVYNGGSLISTGTTDIGNSEIASLQVGDSSTDHATFSTVDLVVGNGNQGTLTGDGQHAVITATGDTTIGYGKDGNGTVLLENRATLDATTTGNVTVGNGDGIIGDFTTGIVTLETGARLNASTTALTGTFTIGENLGTGTVDVGVNSSSFANLDADTLVVGDTGQGSLDVNGAHAVVNIGTGNVNVANTADAGASEISLTNGAILNAQSLTLGPLPGTFLIGSDEGSTGTVTVGESSADTATLNVDNLTVGSYGTGTLNISGTSAVNVGTGVDTTDLLVSIGDQTTYNSGSNTYTDGVGTVIITGGGDLNAAVATVSIGSRGAGSVYVDAGSTLEADTLVVGDAGTGALYISGTGAKVTVESGNVTLGATTTTVSSTRFGLGTIVISDGGTLDANTTGGTFAIGNNQASAGYWQDTNNYNAVFVGEDSSDTATLQTAALTVGKTSTGLLDINGAHAVVTVNSGSLTIGDGSGSDGSVYVSGGAELNASATNAILGNSNGSFGELVVGQNYMDDNDIAGSFTANSLIVGNAGQGYLSVYNGSSATVANGIDVSEQSSSYAGVSIEGDGSILTATTGDVKIGNANGSEGYITVSYDGTLALHGGDLQVGSLSGGYGTLQVYQGSTVNVTDGNLYINNGTVGDFDNSAITLSGDAHLLAGSKFFGGGDSTITTSNFYNAGEFYVNDSDPLPAPGLTHFTLNGNYVGQGGTLNFSAVLNSQSPANTGLLIIKGNTSGNSLVNVTNVGGNGGPTNVHGIEIMQVDGTNAGTFALDKTVTAGAYDYSLSSITAGPSAGLYLVSSVAPGVVGAASIATAGQFLELASLDSVVQRAGELEQTYQADVSGAEMKDGKTVVDQPTSVYNTSEVWSRGIYRYDNVHTSFGLTQNTGVGQIGGDYQFRSVATANDRLYIGAMADYGQSSASTAVQNVHVDGEAVDFGAYATYVTGGYYADLVLEGDLNHFKVQGPDGDFGASGSGLSTAFETGYAFNVGSGFKVEPELGLVYQYESYNTPTDEIGRTYNLSDPDFLQGRISLRIDKSFEYCPGLHLTPYLRVNGLDQFLGDNQTTVSGATFNENLGGGSIGVDGGVTMDVSKNVSIYATGNSAWGQKDDNYGASAGVKISW